jgi:hypothetical protein
MNLKKGDSVAVAVGSRGITNIALITKCIIDSLKIKGAKPFIVPAMGSHGGGTARGQKELLKSYGVTEDYCGCPIKSSMEVVELPSDGLENKVYMDKYAYEADGTVVINRIKTHTDFSGEIESGLLKMIVIGLGKRQQATAIHDYGVYGLKHLILPTAKQILKYGNIIMGIGIVENAYNNTAIIKAILPEDIERTEIELLKIARRNMHHLPYDDIDILIVDEMGKNISGSGMDTKIIGRIKISTEKDPDRPKIKNIIVCDLTHESHGNASGIGLADMITKKLYNKIDLDSTYANCLVSNFYERAKIPIIMENPYTATLNAIRACNKIKIEDLKIMRIKNTLNINEVYVSQYIYKKIKNKYNIKAISNFESIFDQETAELKKF